MTAPITERDREAAMSACRFFEADAGPWHPRWHGWRDGKAFGEGRDPGDEMIHTCCLNDIAKAIVDARAEGREEARQYVLLACERALEKGDAARAGQLREAYLELVERMP